MKLSDLRPCDNCGGKVYPSFYVLRMSLALVKAQAVNQFMGLSQYFGGQADGLAMMFAPEADSGVLVFGDEDNNLITEIFICNECYLKGPVDLAAITEKINERREKDSAQEGNPNG